MGSSRTLRGDLARIGRGNRRIIAGLARRRVQLLDWLAVFVATGALVVFVASWGPIPSAPISGPQIGGVTQTTDLVSNARESHGSVSVKPCWYYASSTGSVRSVCGVR